MISTLDPALWAPLVLAIQVFGLLTACVARMSRGSRGQSGVAILFVVTLVAVALSTMISKFVGNAGGLLMGAASLGTMVMLALWERPRTAFDDLA